MGIESFIKDKRRSKDILVMGHVVCGYPSFEENFSALEIMEDAGVDLVELQFPFSEPSADGPLFVKANEMSIKSGTTVNMCFEFMSKVSKRFSFKVLMMGYYNTIFQLGEDAFVSRLKDSGGEGYIIPDLPVEEATKLHTLSRDLDLDPIILMTQTSSDDRLKKLGESSSGMVYAVARKGVTGSKTTMDESIDSLITRCRANTSVPLGVGFGISSKSDLDFLKGKADVAIIGTAALQAWETSHANGYKHFFESLQIS